MFRGNTHRLHQRLCGRSREGQGLEFVGGLTVDRWGEDGGDILPRLHRRESVHCNSVSIEKGTRAQSLYQTHLCVPIDGGDIFSRLDAVSPAILKKLPSIQLRRETGHLETGIAMYV